MHARSPSSVAMAAGFLLVAAALGTLGGFLMHRGGVLLQRQVLAVQPPGGGFDVCTYEDQASCEAACSYTCYAPGEPPDTWCCPKGCTWENFCGDLRISSTSMPPEECDTGGTCVGGSMGGTCTTLELVQKCAALGGKCEGQDGDPGNCDVACQSTIPECGNGTCGDPGENCLTCDPDCRCPAGKSCNDAGSCVGGSGGGGYCGDRSVQGAEQCDDGNTNPGDGCSATCTCEACGDGYKCETEQCDDGCIAPGNPPGCDDLPLNSGDGCSSTCVKEPPPPTCTDKIKNQGEAQVDCGGPCPPCPCTSDADCNDGLYCTKDTCVVNGSPPPTKKCQYVSYNGFGGGADTYPCSDPTIGTLRLCESNPSQCFCNEKRDRCELCGFGTEVLCKQTSNARCQDYGNPPGCYDRLIPPGPGPEGEDYCCPGRQ